MSCSMPRAGKLLLAVLLTAWGAAAGELYRPVPSDAQVTRFTRFNIRYSLRDIVADGVQKVEFYITEDMGRTWRLYGEDADRISPMTVQVPGEGVYGFVCIATDRFGNREREPGPRTRPETVIVVDRTPPQAKWLAPTQDILGRAGAVELAWEASDANFSSSPVKIQHAVDARSNHDRDAVWNTLQENLSASGRINWTPPAGASGKYNFRLIAEDRAGNLAVAYCAATVVVDTSPPAIAGVSPLRSNKLENDIMVQADDGPSGSGVKEISLYTTDNNAGTWTLVKETTATGESIPVKRAPGQGIAFAAPRSGAYGLWPVVFDEAGNATSLPSIGVVGPYVLTIDTEAPTVTVSNSFLHGMAAVLANETRRVEWNAYDPHLMPNSAAIHLSLDNGNTWQELRSGMPASGSDIINFPFGSQSEEAKLKVTVSDEFGNTGEGLSDTFKLARAGTTITDVTPVGSGGASYPSGSGSTGVYGGFGDDIGTPPVIPAPPSQPGAGQYPTTYPQTSDGISSFPDPFSPFTGESQPALPQSYDQQYPAYQGTPGVTPVLPPATSTPLPALPSGPPIGESTANSLPEAMIGSVTTPPATSSQSPVAPPAAPAMPATSAPPAWQPSPGAGTPVTPPAAPSTGDGWGTAGPALPPPTTTSEPSVPPFGSAGDDMWSTPPAPPSWEPATSDGFPATPSAPVSATPSAPSSGTGTAPADDWFGGGSMVAPPPLPGGDSEPLSAPALSPASPFPGFDPGGLNVPPLPGQTDAPSLATAPTTPATPIAPSTTPSPLSAPATPATPSATPFTPPSSPAQPGGDVPSLPAMSGLNDSLSPPPLAPTSPARPSNPRQLSEQYVGEYKSYLGEGRVDLALESARKAVEADESNAAALMALSQVYAQDDPAVNNFPNAANLAKEATNLRRDWETWWNCADVFYRWSHKRNTEIQELLRRNMRPPLDIVDERNQSLSNARIAINNAATLLQQSGAGEADRKKAANTQGLIAYLQARTIPEPINPGEAAGSAAMSEYRSAVTAYKAAVTPALQEALPYFRTAMTQGAPAYSETFHLGIINFRLGGLEKDSGNLSQGMQYYQEAVRYLEEATTARDTPAGGPREAYYMLANCYDLLADQAGPNRARYKELALRYWRQTADFYPIGSPYRNYSEQRIDILSQELGQ